MFHILCKGVLLSFLGASHHLVLAETEKQVSEHLEGHLQRLPAEDHESRAILEQMRDEEVQHGEGAIEKGGAELPAVAKNMMRFTAKIMTSVSYRL